MLDYRPDSSELFLFRLSGIQVLFTNERLRLLQWWILTCLALVSTNTFSQIPQKQPAFKEKATQSTDQKEYQNQQRAFRLVLMKNEIKALDDAPMRCFTRLQIVRFIFENDVRGEFDSANSMAIDCLEDTVNNSDQFSGTNSYRWKNWAFSLLRQNSPDLALKAEKKYLINVDSTLADLEEFDRTSNATDIADRTIARISSGKVSNDVFTIYQKIRDKDPRSANRILNALLGYFENTPNTATYAIMLDFMRDYFLDPSTPVDLTRRYLEFVVNLSRRQISDPDMSQTAQFVLWTLKFALPRIKEMIPAIYPEAQSIFLVLDVRMHKNDREKVEAYARIEESKDKLQQAISEAEAAEKKPFEDELWQYASKLALERKKFQIAVDCRLKFAFGKAKTGFVSDHDYFLANQVLPAALKDKDFESGAYIIKRVEDDIFRASGMLKIAARWLELGDKVQSFENLEAAMKLLQKCEQSAATVRVMLSAVPIAIGIEKSKAFETVSSAVNTANHLPTPAVDDKIGTPSRVKYVDNILLPSAFNLENAFKILAKSDVGFSAATAQEIQSKSWRLVAEIVVETERKYPMPVKMKKSVQNITP